MLTVVPPVLAIYAAAPIPALLLPAPVSGWLITGNGCFLLIRLLCFHPEVLLEHLKKYRVKTDLRNDQGLTPIHIACSQGHVEAAR